MSPTTRVLSSQKSRPSSLQHIRVPKLDIELDQPLQIVVYLLPDLRALVLYELPDRHPPRSRLVEDVPPILFHTVHGVKYNTLVMLVSVAERTKEIGLRKAVGATDEDVLFQFLFEALFLILIGGAIGIALGWGVSMVLPEILLNFPTSVSGTSIVVAFGVSALVGLISGISPAYRAARLEPVEALRSER